MVEVIKKRKSVRRFQDKEVPQEILDEVVAEARLAPSAGAIRGYKWHFTKEQFGNVKAPIHLVVCADKEAYTKYGDRGELYSIQDATIFGAYIQLVLVDKGLDSCWVGAFREEKVRRMLKLNSRPIAIIAIGYEQPPA